MNLHPLIQDRSSRRAFSDRPVPREVLDAIFEAARWAPSSGNRQPWRFLVATKEQPEDYRRLLAWLRPGNQLWAQSAPVLALTFVPRPKPEALPIAFYDLGLATGQLTVQANALGLAVHVIGGIERESIADELKVPDGMLVVTGLVIGYPDPEKEPPRERLRRPLEEILSYGTDVGFAGPPD